MPKTQSIQICINKISNILTSKYLLLSILLIIILEPTLELWSMRHTDTHPRNWAIPIVCLLVTLSSVFIYRRIGLRVLVSGRSFWTGLLLALLFNVTLNKEVVQQTHQLSHALLLTTAIIFASYAIFQRLTFLLWMPILFVFVVQFAAMEMYHIDLNAGVLAQIFNANQDEVLTYLNSSTIMLIILFIITGSLCCYIMHLGLRKESRITMLTTACLFIFLLYLSRYYFQPIFYNQDCGLWPVKALKHIGSRAMNGVKENEEIRDMIYALPSPADSPSSSPILKGGEDVTILLHIGESVTSDHLMSHGYHRNTMPFVNAHNNVIMFKDCTASSIYTVYSMVTILTNARRGYNFCKDEKMKPSVASFADLLVKHSFKQYCLFSHGTMIHEAGQNTLPKILHYLTKKSSATYSNTGLPSEQISQLQSILNKSGRSNKIILINNEGSHVPFLTYDKKAAIFSQVMENLDNISPEDDASNIEKINNYDNTIYYTDNFIKNAISLLDGKPYIYIYISDHGEYLGENGHWNRTAGDNPDYFFKSQGSRIPFFIFYSPELQKLHPHFANAITNLKLNSNLRTAHEHIFHTILGIVGISSPHYEKSLDLSSSKAAPYTESHYKEK